MKRCDMKLSVNDLKLTNYLRLYIDKCQTIFINNVNELNYLVQLFKHLSAANFNNDYFKMYFPMLSFLFFVIKLPVRLILQHKHFLAS